MPVRLLAYVGLLLQELIRQGKLKAGDLLPAILPIVLYRGDLRWRAPLDLASLFVPVPSGLDRYLPQLRYVLLDESRLPLDLPDLQENLVAALFRLETAAPEDAIPLVKDLSGLMTSGEAGLQRAFSIWLARLFRRFSPGVTIPEEIDLGDLPMLERTLTKLSEQLRQEGRQEGQQEGLLNGMRKLLLEQLRLRFGPLPPTVRRRIAKISSEAALKRLGKKILSANSLEDLKLG